MSSLQDIQPSTFVVPHAEYSHEKISKINLPNNSDFRGKLYEAEHESILGLLKKQSSSNAENATSIIFGILGILSLFIAFLTFQYVQTKKEAFFNTETQNIRTLDVNGIHKLTTDDVGLHIISFPTLKNTITTNDKIILPPLYSGSNELLSTGNTIGITCSYYTPGYPETKQANPPYYYVDIWKKDTDSNLNYRLQEGTGVIYSVGRVNGQLQWLLIRTNNF